MIVALQRPTDAYKKNLAAAKRNLPINIPNSPQKPLNPHGSLSGMITLNIGGRS
jgi:hypothetical protein